MYIGMMGGDSKTESSVEYKHIRRVGHVASKQPWHIKSTCPPPIKTRALPPIIQQHHHHTTHHVWWGAAIRSCCDGAAYDIILLTVGGRGSGEMGEVSQRDRGTSSLAGKFQFCDIIYLFYFIQCNPLLMGYQWWMWGVWLLPAGVDGGS